MLSLVKLHTFSLRGNSQRRFCTTSKKPPLLVLKDRTDIKLGSDVQKALTMTEAILVVENAFKQHHQGKTNVPLRPTIDTEWGPSLFMPALVKDKNDLPILGIKVISIRPNNISKNLPTVPAMVFLLSSETGIPMALMDGTYLTALRTAAGSGAATKYLARENVTNLVVFGAGNQARAHIEAMVAVRPSLKYIKIINRNYEKAQKLANQLCSEKCYKGIYIEASKSVEQDLSKADVVVTATNTSKPLFDGNLLQKGTHINCIGNYTPDTQEVDATTIKRSLVVVDTTEAALSEPGDIIIPLKQKIITEDHIRAELGAVVTGKKVRTSSSDITLFKSCGNAIQDVSVAHAVYTAALAQGLGQEIEL